MRAVVVESWQLLLALFWDMQKQDDSGVLTSTKLA
jgi:hypothetical protein